MKEFAANPTYRFAAALKAEKLEENSPASGEAEQQEKSIDKKCFFSQLTNSK